MRKILLIMLCISFLSGCNSDPSLSSSEISQESLNKDIQSFFQEVKKENGVHLYFDNKNKTIFVYLNGVNVDQSDKALYFTDFEVEEDGDTLNFLYKFDETSNYSNSLFKNELFYREILDKEYEVLKLFKNGRETSFGSVSGNF